MPLINEALWKKNQPILPPEQPRPKGGRLRGPDRLALTGILFVARTGTAWDFYP